MKRRHVLGGVIAVGLAAGTGAMAQPAALSPPVTLTVGYQKVGHLAPILLVEDDLKRQGVELKLVEFARYADARTALLSGSLDMASVGPADLAIALANGATGVVGMMGVGSSPKYVIGKTGVKLDSWDDLKGKKVGIAPGSAVWFQFAATLTERGVPYSSFSAVNIQGAGTNFDQALQRGDVDAIITWEPFESIPVMQGYGFFAKNLDYSQSKSVGAELGMFMATKKATTDKREAVQRFVNAYVAKMKTLQSSPQEFAGAMSKLTGLEPQLAAKVSETIRLGAVITPDQIKRQAKAFHELGVIQKDVSGEIDKYWAPEFVQQAAGG